MRTWRLLVALALVAVVARGSYAAAERRWQQRRDQRVIKSAIHRGDRFVDLGVRLRVVEFDPRGEKFLPGKPRMHLLREHVRGGVIDTALRVPVYVEPTIAPVTWYCSEDAEEVILHDRELLAPNILLYGAMGASKTTTSAQWLWFRILERVGTLGELGCTVPTNDRAGAIRDEILNLWRPEWRTWRERRKGFVCVTRHRVRFVTTTRKSRAQGSPVQNWNWLDAVSEEIQDSIAEDGNIEARGRSAPEEAPFRRLANATAKDDPEWRAFRDRILATGIWVKRKLTLERSPFIPKAYIDRLRKSLTPRDFERQVNANDVGPERVVYTQWNHDLNLRPIPQLGATDVTALELARFGYPNFTVLVGHDPGRTVDVSLLLKAYRIQDQPLPWWWVVGELTTAKTTAAAHAKALLDLLATNFHCNLRDRHGNYTGPRALVRIDPYGDQKENDDKHPDKTLYTTYRKMGLFARAAAYKSKPGGPITIARIPQLARIDVVNTLLGTEDGTRRLFVACDHAKQPVAPRLVEAFERSEKDIAGRVEVDRKGPGDLSHWPCATGYAVWEIEHPRLEAMRRRAA